MPDIAEEVERLGFCLVPRLARDSLIEDVKAALNQCEIARAQRGGQTYGARNLLHLANVRAVTAEPKIVSCLQKLLGPAFLMVRGLFFDKMEGANWPVPWHQDLSLAVRDRCDLPGWSNWTVKRGVTHVQPPAEILRRMVTMRLHLDDCPAANGPLRLVPESHRRGVLGRDEIAVEVKKQAKTILASAGDALFMRPLILHASSPAQAPHHRRVLHLEFAPLDLLPPMLAWAEA
jgi:ectoine hydroxylase-related dioxygenase (phytanoyl-CoA dioxygenase family)